MILKNGSRGDMVKALQELLGLKPDGAFGPATESAVKAWQKQNGLVDDGVVGTKTWAAMGIATTDCSETGFGTTESLAIKQSFLPTGEFMEGTTAKRWLFLHHTAGWQNPYNVIADWARDARGPIATEFIVGGQSVRGNDTKFDGEVVQAMPQGAYAWHLGLGNTPMHRESVGIEVCSFGQLTQGGFYKMVNGQNVWEDKEQGKFYTYVGTEAHPNQVVTLAAPYRGFTHWHGYSPAQLRNLRALILYIAQRDGIDVTKGIVELIKSKGIDAFDVCDVDLASRTPGLWLHANVSRAKWDMFPQQEVIDMLLSL